MNLRFSPRIDSSSSDHGWPIGDKFVVHVQPSERSIFQADTQEETDIAFPQGNVVLNPVFFRF